MEWEIKDLEEVEVVDRTWLPRQMVYGRSSTMDLGQYWGFIREVEKCESESPSWYF